MSDRDAPALDPAALIGALESLQDIMCSKEIADRTPDREALPELRELREGPEIDR